jgi:hypothetical protein
MTKYGKKLLLNFLSKVQFTYPLASTKEVLATEEAFSPLLLWVIFALLDPDKDPLT